MTARCHCHCLSLAIKSITKDCTIICDVMGTVGEICVLDKYSSKREKMMGSIVQKIEGEFEGSSRSDNQKLDKLCVSRKTIRAKCFIKILDNYEALLELWGQSLKDNLDFDTKSEIRGCENQMKLFNFHFGLNLSQRLYAVTDNLSKTCNRKRCLPLEEGSFLTLLFKHWKT